MTYLKAVHQEAVSGLFFVAVVVGFFLPLLSPSPPFF